MAAMTATLTEFADNVNTRTYSTAGHTASKPKLLFQRRKVPAGSEGIAETTFDVVQATEDADGNILASKVSASVVFRFPINGDSAEVDSVEVLLRDLVASDEFSSSVRTQNWAS